MNVLIAENQKANRPTLSKYLKQDGHNYFLAKSEDEAWEIFGKENIQVIFSDITAFCKKVRMTTRKVYIVFVSTMKNDWTQLEFVMNNANNYLSSPLRRQTFTGVMQKALIWNDQ